MTPDARASPRKVPAGESTEFRQAGELSRQQQSSEPDREPPPPVARLREATGHTLKSVPAGRKPSESQGQTSQDKEPRATPVLPLGPQELGLTLENQASGYLSPLDLE